MHTTLLLSVVLLFAPLLHVAQAATDTVVRVVTDTVATTGGTGWHVSDAILLAIQAGLVRAIMAALKWAPVGIGRLPAWAQQVLVVVIALALGALQHFTGVATGQDLGSITSTSVASIVAAILAMVTHNGAKLSQLKNGELAGQSRAFAAPRPVDTDRGY